MKILGTAITIALATASPAACDMISECPEADHVLIEKAAHRLTVFYKDKRPAKVLKVALGSRGPKERKGDGRTPEGLYRIAPIPLFNSFYIGRQISYPNAQDKARAATLGVDPGGDIMIHGIHYGFGWLGALHRVFDWTNGSIALTNEEIGHLSCELTDTPIDIRP